MTDKEWVEHNHLVPLCRQHHSDVHSRLLTIKFDDGMIATWQFSSGGKGERALVLVDDPKESDVRKLSDAALATAWAAGTRYGEFGIIMQSTAAYGFYLRYNGYGNRVSQRIAEIIRDVTGVAISSSVVYERIAQGIALKYWPGNPRDLLGPLGAKATAAVGRAITAGEEPEEVFEYALARRDDGERQTVTARAVEEKFHSAESSPRESCDDRGFHECKCGTQWAEDVVK